MAEWIKKKQDVNNTQAESEKMEKDILWKQKPKESRGGHTNRAK